MPPFIYHWIHLAALTVCMNFSKAKANLTIRCESKGYAPNECFFEGSYNTIEKTKQLSNSPCELNITYGLNPNSIWVSKGCRAEFLLKNTAITASTSLESTSETYPVTTTDITMTEPRLVTIPNVTLHTKKCSCNCSVNYTEATLRSTIQKLKNELKVNKTLLSSTIRRKTSAADERLSSKAIGSVGILFLLFVFGCVIAMDLTTVCMRKNKKVAERRKSTK